MLCHLNSIRAIRLKGLGLLVLLAATSVSSRAEEPTRWPFKDGDRIVLVGDTLIERDQRYGYLETYLTLAEPDLNLTFRNLGWSGDTVRGLSRAGFDPPEAGFREMVKQVLAAKPTVLIVGYGMADSFDGEAGLSRFEEGMNAFLDAVSTAKARLIFLSPIPHENLGPPLPDPTDHNRLLGLYTEAVRKISGERGGRFVDLQEVLPRWAGGTRITDNGIHLNEPGYNSLAVAVGNGLGLGEDLRALPTLEIDGDGKVTNISAAHWTVSDIRATPGALRFKVTSKVLPSPPVVPELHVPGLAPGRHSLRIDGKLIATAAAAEWEKGIGLRSCPERDQVERLRRTINEKNLLFFHRWRPQNQTYLFGFRKHEQGNNAIEVPQFDPLIEAKEKEIAALRKPLPHVYELVKESEVTR